MKKIKLPLFPKFLIITIIIVTCFGVINIYMLHSSIYKSFEKEINKRAVVLSKIISEKILTPLVYEDIVSLYSIVDEVKLSDPDILYIFILNNKNRVVANTDSLIIPVDLITVNNTKGNKFNITVFRAKNLNHKKIRDIAYPILNGELGTVRMGLIEDDIKKEQNKAIENSLIMIISFLFIGLGGSFVLSYYITSPIKQISQKAQSLNLVSFEKEDFAIVTSKYKRIGNLFFHDELDILTDKFSEMITRLNINYNELKNTQNSLIQSEKLASIGTLSAGIAHEINNPLSGIRNCANRIAKFPEKTKQNKEYIELIKEATSRIESVVKGLLNFSRKQDIAFTQVNLIETIERTISLAIFKTKKHNIAIEKDYEADNIIIKGSSIHLEQVFLNLFINAADAISSLKKNEPDLTGKILLKVYQNKEKVFISVKDNGIGIPDDVAIRIFDPFYTTKETNQGTGLGLSVSYNIVQEHFGKIYVQKTKENFTEFVVELPNS